VPFFFGAYEKLHGKTIEQVIKKETSGNLEDVYLTIVGIARDPIAFWAQKLNNAMKGLGTDDHTLIRVLVNRAPIDLVEVKAKYGQTYDKPLVDHVKSDCSGDYKNMLLAIIE